MNAKKIQRITRSSRLRVHCLGIQFTNELIRYEENELGIFISEEKYTTYSKFCNKLKPFFFFLLKTDTERYFF